MNRKFTRLVAAVLALMLMVPGSVFAQKYGYKIDVSAMKALEEASAFPVRVVQKKVVEELYDVTDYYLPADALTLTVRNNTDTDVTGFAIYWVAYDEEGKTCEIDSESIIASFSPGTSSPRLYSAELTGNVLPAHSETSYDQRVHWDEFVGVRSIIAWYTDSKGNVISNPDFSLWQTLAYGLTGESSTELD